MVQKRPFNEDVPNEVSSKQQRQLEHSNQFAAVLCEALVQGPHPSGYHNAPDVKPECGEEFDVASPELPFCAAKDSAAKALGSVPCSSSATSCISEENVRLEEPFHHPDHCNGERQPRITGHPEEIYSYLLDHPPRKVVPVGPDFQADIPDWSADCSQTTFSCSDTHEVPHLPSHNLGLQIEISDHKKNLLGTSIIPMPEYRSPTDCAEAGLGKTDCLCEVPGSIRCHQLHILEARAKLSTELGPDTFAELGFCDMGEVVADKWSKEEEKLFHNVIFSNPISQGKNFWKHLAAVFPYRTKMEIVRYYFNVFLIRRRAEQNRFYPLNIDSDNDEWQEPDDLSYDMSENEDDDLAVESPVDTDGRKSFGTNLHACYEDVSQISHVDHPSLPCGKQTIDVLGKCPGKVYPEQSSDIHDGSCKIDGSGLVHKATTKKNDSHNKQWAGHLSGMNGSIAHEFMLEAYWDFQYLTCPKKVDLLPTCSMIEEVFGAES